MSFIIVTGKKHMSYVTVDEFLSDSARIRKHIAQNPVTEFDIGDNHGCLNWFLNKVENIPLVRDTRRLTYYGELAQFLVYNLALSAEFPTAV